MGFEVEAAHHEVAHGQHEIDFRYADALKTADNIATFRFVVKHVAQPVRLPRVVHAEADPGRTAAGCTRTSRCSAARRTRSGIRKAEWQLSKMALHYIGGLLRHARGLLRDHESAGQLLQAAGAGYEAPVNVAWSMRNRSPLSAFPTGADSARASSSRMPDPAATRISRSR